ncbi:MAG: type IV conjugative transfer system lipoprotein TraV [Deltaproteobacteria bacterium]|nr:type IV conjugative transfer system lipoprotein TraV [Deltaproteobacteria bacterium]
MRLLIKNFLFLSLLPAFLGVVSGCSALTPYSSSFQCPDVDKGKCVSVSEAYEESLNDSLNGSGKKNREEGVKNDSKKENKKDDTEPGYKSTLQKKLTNLIDNPVTPVVIPPKALRVLIFPYASKSELYMPRYIYILIDDPKWVVGDYLIKEGR